jgi:Trk K+ transport system NAD-binding subunit
VRRAVAAVQGDARSAETLGQAHLGTARALVAVTDDDVENLGVALAARRLNPAVRTAVRTFDVDLGARLQGQLGLDRVLSVSAVAAPYFAGAVTDPALVLAIAWRGHLVLVSEVEVPGSAPVAMPGGRLFVHSTPLVDPHDGAGIGGMVGGPQDGPDDAA